MCYFVLTSSYASILINIRCYFVLTSSSCPNSNWIPPVLAPSPRVVCTWNVRRNSSPGKLPCVSIGREFHPPPEKEKKKAIKKGETWRKKKGIWKQIRTTRHLSRIEIISHQSSSRVRQHQPNQLIASKTISKMKYLSV